MRTDPSPSVIFGGDFQIRTIRNLVVAYDDSPERYDTLARKAALLGWVVVCVEHPIALTQILDNHDPIAVLLDHDVRPVAVDVYEGDIIAGIDAREYSGHDVARDILAGRSVPVIVSSANRPGAARIYATLKEAGVPVRVISVLESAPEERWLGALAEYAVRS